MNYSFASALGKTGTTVSGEQLTTAAAADTDIFIEVLNEFALGHAGVCLTCISDYALGALAA